MIHRFLSMNKDWIQVLSEIQPYTQVLEPKQLYLILLGYYPKEDIFLNIQKAKVKQNMRIGYRINSKRIYLFKPEFIDYLEIFTTREGRENVKYICEKYGIDKKEITKLKLKI